MQNRLRLSNGTYFMEFENNKEGMFRAKHFRGVFANLFYRRRIKSIIQALPDDVPLNTVLEHWTCKKLENPLGA